MKKTALLLSLILILALACASSDKRPDPAEGAAASSKFFAAPQTVLKATKGALADYGLIVTGVAPMGTQAWNLQIKKGPASSLPGDLKQVMVRGVKTKETMVYLIVERSFLERWTGGKPDWAGTLFTRIYEKLP